jgi:hypothetical protein
MHWRPDLPADSLFDPPRQTKLLAILDLIRIGVLIPALITVSHWYDIETIAMSRTAVMELSIFKIYGVIF